MRQTRLITGVRQVMPSAGEPKGLFDYLALEHSV
jgi:hypothetical protein